MLECSLFISHFRGFLPNKRRYAYRHSLVCELRPFETSEEAWFWFMRCQSLRRDGARFEQNNNPIQRPCEPDDIATCVLALVRSKALTRAHIRVLSCYGKLSRPPDPRDRNEARDGQLWDSAMNRLMTVMISKGIVACPMDDTNTDFPASNHLRPADQLNVKPD